VDRRDFLRRLGLTAAATALAPASLVQAAGGKREILTTTYPLSVGNVAGATFPSRDASVSAYILEAPKGQLCRAALVIPEDAPPHTVASIFACQGGNEPGQIVIHRVGLHEESSLLYGDLDAAVFKTQELYCPVDFGAVRRGRALEIDYSSFRFLEGQFLYLALYHHNFVVQPGVTCPPGSEHEGHESTSR
jgi:hypothetical protein